MINTKNLKEKSGIYLINYIKPLNNLVSTISG